MGIGDRNFVYELPIILHNKTTLLLCDTPCKKKKKNETDFSNARFNYITIFVLSKWIIYVREVLFKLGVRLGPTSETFCLMLILTSSWSLSFTCNKHDRYFISGEKRTVTPTSK